MVIKEEDAKAEREPVKLRYDPLALEKVPQVAKLLAALGLGEFDQENITSHIGRNDNWAGRTSTGHRIFVKHIGGDEKDVRARFDRATAFERAFARAPQSELRSPAYIGSDEESRLVAFELLDDCQSGAEMATNEEFDNSHAHRAGRIIGHLQNLPVEPRELDDSPPSMPPMESLRALSLPQYMGSSAAQIESWGLLQNDTALIQALHQLRSAELESPRCPSHCDLRLDQFLFVDGQLYLTDWEEFRTADPARDIGSFAGEWLYRAVIGIPSALATDRDPNPAFGPSHEDVVAQGVQGLDRLRPRIQAFCTGYREMRPHVDAALAQRAAAYAGWHLIERMLAGAAQRARLAAVDRGAAGIGRSALLAPDSFTQALGLEALV